MLRHYTSPEALKLLCDYAPGGSSRQQAIDDIFFRLDDFVDFKKSTEALNDVTFGDFVKQFKANFPEGKSSNEITFCVKFFQNEILRRGLDIDFSLD